jgi:GTP1/Obg family GTP-binding protein
MSEINRYSGFIEKIRKAENLIRDFCQDFIDREKILEDLRDFFKNLVGSLLE